MQTSLLWSCMGLLWVYKSFGLLTESPFWENVGKIGTGPVWAILPCSRMGFD